MLKRIAALLLCAAAIAGCSAAPSQPESSSLEPSSSQPDGQYVPEYTYQNPDPDMVLVTSPGGDITYEKYRLYLDMSELLSRFAARQQMAICAALERDFAGMGLVIDEAAYDEMAESQLEMMGEYYPTFMDDLSYVAKEAGMTQAQAIAAAKLSFRMEHLVTLLGEHFQAVAAEEFDGLNQIEVIDSAGYSPEELEALKEQQRQQAIYTLAMEKLDQYSAAYNERLSLDNEDMLAAVDGEELPYTDELIRFIDYSAVSARLEAAALIQQGELVLRELERRGETPDEELFKQDFNAYLEAVRAESGYVDSISPYAGQLGATMDDYYLVIERMSWLEDAGNRYYQLLLEEHERLYAADSGEPEIPFDQYYLESMDKLFEGSEIVNLTGK